MSPIETVWFLKGIVSRLFMITKQLKKDKNDNMLLSGIKSENGLSEAFGDGLTAETVFAKNLTLLI